MEKMPALNKSAPTVARIAIPSGLALAAALFPDVAGAIGVAAPVVVAATERVLRRASSMLEASIRKGGIEHLRDEEFEHLVPMAYRFFEAARQGEFEHNLKLLAAFLAAELKTGTCTSGAFVDIARRLEGLSITSLRAVALIGEKAQHAQAQGRPSEEGIAVTPDDLFEPKLKPLAPPLTRQEAVDALSDLTGRGLLYSHSLSGYGGSQQHFSTTKPMRELLARALDIATTEACHHHPTDVDRY